MKRNTGNHLLSPSCAKAFHPIFSAFHLKYIYIVISLVCDTINVLFNTPVGARGGAVVEALLYKPEGRGIDSR
jgi:hypothetical protein